MYDLCVSIILWNINIMQRMNIISILNIMYKYSININISHYISYKYL